MAITAKNLIDRFGKTKDEKNKFKNLYDDVYKFGMPSRYKNITEVQKAGEKNREEIFSSCFEQACDEFVQRFQSIVCPVNTDWIDFEAGYNYTINENANVEDVNKELSKIANICNVYKSASNYDTSFTEMCYDLIAGTACLLIKEGTIDNPLVFNAIPFVNLAMEEGANGEIIAYFRIISLKNSQVQYQWLDAKYTFEDSKSDEMVEFLEATYYDQETKLWNYTVIDQKKEEFIVEKKSQCSPFNDLRWSKCAGETYGRGVGLKVIADVKTLNKVKEYSLRALSFTIPTFTCSLEDGYNPEKFVLLPGAINPVPSNATNNPTVRQLEINQMPDITQFNITQLEMDIKRSMFASTIPNDPSKKTTATEIAQRVSELDNSLNNSFGRLIEFLYRVIRRQIEVLQKFGYISNEIDVMAFNGYGYKIKINTQLANQQTQQEITQILQSLQILAQFDPSMTFTGMALDLDGLLPYVLDKMGIPNQFIRTKEQILQLKQQQAAAMEEQENNAISKDVAASNAKEQGKENAKRQDGRPVI